MPKEKDALEKAAAVDQDFADVFGTYAGLVPEYADWKQPLEGKEISYGLTKRAAAEVTALAFGKDGHELSARTLKNNVGMYMFRLRVKIDQLLGNPEWMAAKEAHQKREEQRLADEQALAEKQGNPKNMMKLTAQRFVADQINIGGRSANTFESAARNVKKLAAEMLTAPTERLILPGTEDNFEAVSIENMVIDPMMISDTLLRNLGLEKFIPPKGMKKADKQAFRDQARSEIRRKLGELRTVMPFKEDPLAHGYYRTFADLDGNVLGTTNTLSRKTLWLTDLDSAVRRLYHIEDNQSEEIFKLRKIQDALRGIDGQLSADWQQLKNTDELQKIKDELAGLVRSLRYVTNQFKREMLALLEESVTLESTFTRKLKDGRVEKVVRLNPGAKRAKLNQVPVKIGERIKEIGRIKTHLSRDTVRMEAVMADHQLIPFAGLKKYIEERAASGKKAPLAGPVLTKEERDELDKKIFDWRRQFDAFRRGMVLQPYRCFAKKLGEKFNLAQTALGSEKPVRKEVAEAVAQMYMVVKLQVFWNDLQKIYSKHLAHDELPYFLIMRDELKELKKNLQQKNVAPGIKTVKFDDTYHFFYQLLDNMITQADEGRQAMRAKDEEKARLCKKQLYITVAGVDIVKIVGAIE